MHEFILKIFGFIKSCLYFIRILCVFLIILLLLYWIENLASFNWTWLNFIKPFFDSLLAFTNGIYSASYNLFGAVFEFKYFIALLMFVFISLCFRYLGFFVDFLQGMYIGTRRVCKKTQEKVLNNTLARNIEQAEKKLTNYTITIQTKLKKKFSHIEQNINIEEQNKLMNDFIFSKIVQKPEIIDGLFVYKFTNFDKIDSILDVLFKVVNSSAPLDYAICIQVGKNEEQLKKLVELKNFGKITIAADTAFRYRYNQTHRYQTSQVGIFQYGENTIEVHEFKEIL